MKFIAISILILLSSAANLTYAQTKNDLKGFNDFLGKEKAKVLNQTVKSFDKFLDDNFPDSKSTSDKTRSYLELIMNYTSYVEKNWKTNRKANKKLLEKWEESGLRIEIWWYDGEEYYADHLEIDTTVFDLETIEDDEIVPFTNRDTIRESSVDFENYKFSNTFGKYLFGLKQFAPNDTLVQDYVDVKTEVGDISPTSVANAFIVLFQDLDEPFIKRIIVVEFYYYFMEWDVERLSDEE